MSIGGWGDIDDGRSMFMFMVFVNVDVRSDVLSLLFTGELKPHAERERAVSSSPPPPPPLVLRGNTEAE